LPLAILFAFKLNWGFKGIWWAMAFAQMFMGVTIQFMAKNASWEKAAEESDERQKLEIMSRQESIKQIIEKEL